MALDTRKYERKHTDILRDTRPLSMRAKEWLKQPTNSTTVFIVCAVAIYFFDGATTIADVIIVIMCLYFWALRHADRSLAFKLPSGSKFKDNNNKGAGRSGKGEGILYLGNVEKTNEEIWFTNNDSTPHV